MKTTVSGILFLIYSLSPLSAYRFPRSKNYVHLRIQPGQGSPIHLNEYVEDQYNHPNTMIRRGDEPLKGILKPRNSNNYEVKVLNIDGLKSLELDDSLESLLALNPLSKQSKQKKNVAFKVVNIDDFDKDRQKSKKSSLNKVKLVQSMTPPNKFFKKYRTNKLQKYETELENSDLQLLLENLNKKGFQDINFKKFKNMYGKKETKGKSIFNDNGIMYLTKPRNTEETKLGPLLNKVLDYKLALGQKRDHLRQPAEIFSAGEIKQIRTIAKAIEEEDRDDDEPEELDQLLEQELERREEADDFKEQDLANLEALEQQLAQYAEPIEVTVEKVPSRSKDIQRQISQALHLINQGDQERSDDDQVNQLDESNNLVAQLLDNINQQSKVTNAIPKQPDADFDSDSIQEVQLVKLGYPSATALENRVNDDKQNVDQLKQIARAIQSAQQVADDNPIPADPGRQEFDFQELVA